MDSLNLPFCLFSNATRQTFSILFLLVEDFCCKSLLAVKTIVVKIFVM